MPNTETPNKSPMIIYVETDPVHETQTVVMDYTIFAAFRHWVESASKEAGQEIMFEFTIKVNKE